jgi:hypothetical protein
MTHPFLFVFLLSENMANEGASDLRHGKNTQVLDPDEITALGMPRDSSRGPPPTAPNFEAVNRVASGSKRKRRAGRFSIAQDDIRYRVDTNTTPAHTEIQGSQERGPMATNDTVQSPEDKYARQLHREEIYKLREALQRKAFIKAVQEFKDEFLNALEKAEERRKGEENLHKEQITKLKQQLKETEERLLEAERQLETVEARASLKESAQAACNAEEFERQKATSDRKQQVDQPLNQSRRKSRNRQRGKGKQENQDKRPANPADQGPLEQTSAPRHPRDDAGLCLYCTRHGHIISACRLAQLDIALGRCNRLVDSTILCKGKTLLPGLPGGMRKEVAIMNGLVFQHLERWEDVPALPV